MNQPTPESAIAVKETRYGRMLYTRTDLYVGQSIELYGEYSEPEVALFRQVLKPGMVAMDVGANMGALTLPLARLVGPQGRVIAIEPQRAHFNLLCGTLALNGLMHVDPIRACLGRENGRTGIPAYGYLMKGNLGNVKQDELGKPGIEPVPLIALDSFKLPRLEFIKIDVEGAECAVLEGAQETIGRLKPILYVENDQRDKSPALISLLDRLGYKAWWYVVPLFNPKNFAGRSDNAFPNTVTVNMFCLPKDIPAKIDNLPPVDGPDDWWKDKLKARAAPAQG
jgi:FkbM family methyltransferase